MKIALLCFVSALTIMSCSKDDQQLATGQYNITENAPQISSWQSINDIEATSSIQVLNQLNQPVVGAQVLIGSDTNSPFKNNLFTTDKNGQIQNLSAWTMSAHITADAPGYVRQTLLNQKPGLVTFKLNPAYLNSQATITGQVTQLPVVDKDKQIDFGLVMSAMTRADLLNFDLNSVISPINDIMKVASYTIPVPSNVSLPKQKESYIIGLTIEKPTYRFFTPTLGTRRLFAAAGRFPFKTVVDELRGGKPFYEVINYFDLQGGGIRDITSTSAITNLDIPGNELSFTAPVTIASPTLNADEVFVALTASEVSGYMIPTGLKKMDSNTSANLKTLDNKPAFTVNVIKKQNEFMSQAPGADRLSAALLPYDANKAPVMLPLVNDPSVTVADGYLIKLPQIGNTTGVYPLAVTAVISEIQISGPADQQTSNLVRKWEVLGTKWPAQIQLPNWPLDATTNKRRFEINYIAGPKKQEVDLGNGLIQAASHVTHSSTDF